MQWLAGRLAHAPCTWKAEMIGFHYSHTVPHRHTDLQHPEGSEKNRTRFLAHHHVSTLSSSCSLMRSPRNLDPGLGIILAFLSTRTVNGRLLTALLMNGRHRSYANPVCHPPPRSNKRKGPALISFPTVSIGAPATSGSHILRLPALNDHEPYVGGIDLETNAFFCSAYRYMVKYVDSCMQ